LNSKAEIIETVKSNVDLTKVLNTKKFNFEEAESNSKWLEQDRFDIQPETEEYGVSSFLYKR
jgi:G3E family GTPase